VRFATPPTWSFNQPFRNLCHARSLSSQGSRLHGCPDVFNSFLFSASSLGLRLHKLPTPRQFCPKKLDQSQEALYAHAYAQHFLVSIRVCIFNDVLDDPGTI
jgi:hypothetical protein